MSLEPFTANGGIRDRGVRYLPICVARYQPVVEMGIGVKWGDEWGALNEGASIEKAHATDQYTLIPF